MKALCVILVSLVLCGCAFGVIDRTFEQQELVNACYEIKKPAFLYEARCVNLDAVGYGGGKLCKSIQGFDPLPYVRPDSSVYEYHYPKSWSDYLSNREVWDKKMFWSEFLSKRRTIIAPIDVGTEIRVVGVYEYPRGTNGHVLVVTARLASGPFQGTIVELPPTDGFNDEGPDWTTQWFYSAEEGVELTKEYLGPCGERSPNKNSNRTASPPVL
jgi:hypothetical protein